MNKENLEKVIADLDDLKNLIEFFSTQDEIPTIEIDIVKKKLQDIYLNFSEFTPSKRQLVSEEKKEVPKTEIQQEPVHKEIPEPEFEIERESKEEVIPVQENIVESKREEKKEIQPQETPVQKSDSTTSKGTLSDKLKGNSVSLNERLSNKKGSDLSSRLQKGPIKDLNEAIGLNDKFLYIKTLFGGDAHKFRETVDYLNGLHSITEAENYISANFSWHMEDKVTQQFLDLINRKLQGNG